MTAGVQSTLAFYRSTEFSRKADRCPLKRSKDEKLAGETHSPGARKASSGAEQTVLAVLRDKNGSPRPRVNV